jgi:hypothetical protein
MSRQTLKRNTAIPSELLASTLNEAEIDSQSKSPLCQLPESLREKIYKFVFTAEDVPNIFTPDKPFQYRHSQQTHPRVHTTLLLTCRAIYYESCLLTILLNPAYGANESASFRIPRGIAAFHPDIPNYLAAWQFAAVSSLMIYTDNRSLESLGIDKTKPGVIAEYATSWLLARERHDGLFVAAKDAQPFQGRSSISTFAEERKDHFSYEIDDPRNRYSTRLWKDKKDLAASVTLIPIYSSLYVKYNTQPYNQAEPITDLTIRIDRQDWFTEEDKQPNFALSPSLSWGREVALFPDLHRLTLRLETFAQSAEELDYVIDCAKLWTFPLNADPEQRVLVWDGHVVAYRWGEEHTYPGNDDSAGVGPSGFEVRIISFILSDGNVLHTHH